MTLNTLVTDAKNALSKKSPLRKRMIWMLLSVFILLGLIVGFNLFKTVMIKKYMAGAGAPPQTVSTMTVVNEDWQPQQDAIGTMRAFRGVDLSTEVNGIIRAIQAKSGIDVKSGQLLIELTQDADVAQLHAMEAQAELAKVINERDKAQLEIQAISKNAFDSSTADLRAKIAQVEQQKALVAKKNLIAPFSGRLGIVSMNPGQFVNPGDKLLTIQTINPIYIDFTLPQNLAAQVKKNQVLRLKNDAYPNQEFSGRVSAISPKIDTNTRNLQIEAIVENPDMKLLPGMFSNVKLNLGAQAQYVTLPQTAVTFNPYGSIVFLAVGSDKKGPDGNALLEAKQTFVTTGLTRGDQIAILSGLKEGDVVVTSGQMKLKNGTSLIVNNSVTPGNNPNPKPQEQ